MLYFAYGSNLCKAAMRRRAPNAKPVIAALLPDHRLTFESNEPLGAPERYFANVRPAFAAFVPGALYEIDASGLRALDDYEDLGRGVYVRIVHDVFRADGKRSSTIVYRLPIKAKPIRSGAPSREQLMQLRLGYADWGLDLRVLDRALTRVSSGRRGRIL